MSPRKRMIDDPKMTFYGRLSYVRILYEFKKPMTVTDIVEETGPQGKRVSKQQVSRELKDLLHHEYVECRSEGLKTFYWLTDKGTMEYEIHKQIERKTPIVQRTIDTSIDLKEYINKFEESKNHHTQELTMDALYRQVCELIKEGSIVDWKKEKEFTNLIKSVLMKSHTYNQITLFYFYEMLKLMYNNNYFNDEDFKIIHEQFETIDISKLTDIQYTIVNETLSLIFIALKNKPKQKKASYGLLILILNRYKTVELNYIHAIISGDSILRSLPNEIKSQLTNDCFKLINSKNPEEERYRIIEELYRKVSR